jgi:hypothetical protein
MARLFSGAPRSLPPRRRVTGTLLTIAQLGYAHWFFGNLYEAIVKVPDRLVSDQEPGAAGTHVTALLGPGSPLRYYLPGAPVTFAATLAALATGWDTPNDRRWLMAAAAWSMAGGAITLSGPHRQPAPVLHRPVPGTRRTGQAPANVVPAERLAAHCRWRRVAGRPTGQTTR